MNEVFSFSFLQLMKLTNIVVLGSTRALTRFQNLLDQLLGSFDFLLHRDIFYPVVVANMEMFHNFDLVVHATHQLEVINH